MKKSEKIISAVLTIAFGILLIVLQSKFIGVLTTIAGICLVTLGVVDLIQKLVPPAVVKLVIGLVILIFGLGDLITIVLYIIAAVLLIIGILMIYDKMKHNIRHASLWYTIMEYALPCIMLVIGLLLLFNQTGLLNFIFIVSGVLTIIEGILILLRTFLEDN